MMMATIPSMMLVTAVIAVALSPDLFRMEESRGDVMSDNLRLFHSKAVEQAVAGGMTAGIISDALTGPFRRMGNWEAVVVSGGHRTVVITHLPRGAEREESSTLKAFSEISPLSLRGLPESYSGTYTYSHTGMGGSIGLGDFSDMDLPLAANTPAVVTIIDQQYVPGGAGSNGGGLNGR